jgi:hypothetical protein
VVVTGKDELVAMEREAPRAFKEESISEPPIVRKTEKLAFPVSLQS